MLVTMMEYRQPVAFSKAVGFLACRRDGLVRRTIHRSPAGPAPGPAHQVGDLGDVLVLLDGAVLVHGGLPAAAGQQPDRLLIGFGDGPAAGEQHLAPRRGQGQQVADQLVAGAGPIDADQQLGPHPSRDLPERRRQHREVVGEGVRSGVARPQQHRQALGGIGAPGPQRVEAVPVLERGSGAFLVAARGDQRRVQVDDQPARQHLPRDGQPREPGRGRADQLPHVRPDRRPRPGDLVQGARIGQFQRPPHRRVRRRRAEDRLLMGQQRDVVHAGGPERDRHRHRDQRHPAVNQRELPLPAQRRAERWRQAALIGQLAQQHRPGVTDQALCVRGHGQVPVPARILRHEERSSFGRSQTVWLPRNLPERGALRYLSRLAPA